VLADLILEWCSSDPEFGFVGVGSEVWHGGIGSVGIVQTPGEIVN